MSSHREAPEISKDPTADNTDVYAFVSPDRPHTVTLIANFLPFQLPYSGPNFNEFADDVVYAIRVSHSDSASADVIYRFRFHTRVRNHDTFLYNTGPITSPSDPHWNRPQTYTLTRARRRPDGSYSEKVLRTGLTVPPANVGVHSTPDYPAIARHAYHDLGNGRSVFAGPRADAFHVDLGSIFDLGDLRPFQGAYNSGIPPVLANMPGVNGLTGLNVHTIALQVPISDLTRNHDRPTDVYSRDAVIGVWATASRPRARIYSQGGTTSMGAWVQVSRLGNPLVNEVLIPMARKDAWNRSRPRHDKQFATYVAHPELADLIANVLYPAAFPHLRAYVNAKKARPDLTAILLTGIPKGIIGGFQNYTGPTLADMLRLNVAIPPTPSAKASPYGILGGDLAGFPNGRRIGDDVTAIELRAVAGATIPLVDPTFSPDAAAAVLNDGTSNDNTPYPLLTHFPYLANPNNGYTSRPGEVGGAA